MVTDKLRHQAGPLHKRAGFALLELLLSITILAIVLGIAMPFLIAAEKGWRQSQSTLDALQNARTAVTMITDGLRRAVAIAHISGTPGQPGDEITFDVDEWTFETGAQQGEGAVAKTIRTTYKAITRDGQKWAELSETDTETGTVRSALVAGPLTTLQFTGYQDDGVTPTTDPTKIRSVEVTVGIQSHSSPGGEIRYSSRVLCRSDTTPAFAVLTTDTPRVALEDNTSISGDVFVGGDAGDVTVARDSKVTDGRIYATGTVSGKGTYQVGRLWEQLPKLPPLDTSYYDGLLAQAAQRPWWNLQIRGGGRYSDTAHYKKLLDDADRTSRWELEVRAGNQYKYTLSSGAPDPVDYNALLAAADATPRWDLEIRAGGTYSDTRVYESLLRLARRPGRDVYSGGLDIEGMFAFPQHPVLVRGNVRIHRNAVLGGPGKLAATGDIRIDEDVTLNGDIAIVAGGSIECAGSIRGSAATLLYAFEPPEPNKPNLDLSKARKVAAGGQRVRAMLVKGDVALRGAAVVRGGGFLVARRQGSLQAESAVGGNVTITGPVSLVKSVSVLSSDTIQCTAAVQGSGATLLYAFRQAVVDLAGGPLLVNGDVWLRGGTRLHGPGEVAAGGRGSDVFIDDNTNLQNHVAVVADDSIVCRGTIQGTGDSLIYGFESALMDLTPGTLLVHGNFWMRGDDKTENPPTMIAGPGTLVATNRVDVDDATRLVDNVTVIGANWVELADDVRAEAETILYSSRWTDLDDRATLVGAMLSPNACDIDAGNRVRGYIYAGNYADIQGHIEWTLPDGTLGGGRVLCRRLSQLRRATVCYEEKPIQRVIPGLDL